jgi:hypothetical protein
MSGALISLAQHINAEHEAAIGAAQSAISHARRAGELLIEAKTGVEHGEWLLWLTTHCPTISARTAQGYMRVATYWPALEANAQRVSHLTLREALALLADPRPHAEDVPNDDDELRRVLALADECEATDRQHRSELRLLRRLLDDPALTCDECVWIVHRAQDLERDIKETQLRASRHLGVMLNRADANGWRPVFDGLLDDDLRPRILELIEKRLAELRTEESAESPDLFSVLP